MQSFAYGRCVVSVGSRQKLCHPCVLRFRHTKWGNWSCFLEKTIMTLHSISVSRGAASNCSFVLDKLPNPVKI